MNDLIKEFQDIKLMKLFEIEVIDVRSREKEHILFNISIDEASNTLQAQHVGLTIEEEQSRLLAFKSIDLDDCFSLDEHLQQLYEVCTEAILNSDFYTLPK